MEIVLFDFDTPFEKKCWAEKSKRMVGGDGFLYGKQMVVVGDHPQRKL